MSNARSTRNLWQLGLVCIAALSLAGCALTREGRLKAKGEEIGSKLADERDKVLQLAPGDTTRSARLDRLSNLRTELTAANLGITASKFLPEDKRPAAYDVIEEMYDAIEWNIPIPPGAQTRPLPKEYAGGKLNFQ